jgi:tryptophan-rich sensory protein
MSIGRLIISLLIPQVVGISAAVVTAGSVRDWYPNIDKPSWTPPTWVFGPVWTALYLMMGVALYRVWGQGLDTPGVKLALGFFAAQMVLNALWSFCFFGMRSPGLALVEIVFLWIAIVGTIVTFGRLDTLAYPLLIPYLLWASFAAVLTASIWLRNR